jgi:hypothetical protein
MDRLVIEIPPEIERRQPAWGAYAFRIEQAPAVAAPKVVTDAEMLSDKKPGIQVTMGSETAGAEIRYTLDGSDPGSRSLFYRGTFTVEEPVTVRARGFKAGMSPSLEVHDEIKKLIRAADPGDLVPGLQFEYFEDTDKSWSEKPSLDGVKPLRSGRVPDFDAVAPGRQDYFAIRFRGFLEVPRTGRYSFHLPPDYAGILDIGTTSVVKNPGGSKGANAGYAYLESGKHPITAILYRLSGGGRLFLPGRKERLEIFIEGPGMETTPISAAALWSAPHP